MSSNSVKRRQSPGHHRRSAGISVDGNIVREARLAAGMSLAQLADGRVSRQAVHLIETGRARPSLEVLRHIARRTGRPVSDFYTDSVSPPYRQAGEQTNAHVLELERLVRSRDYSTASELGTKLLEESGGTGDEAPLLLLTAEALVMSRQPEPALRHLRVARQLCEEALDKWALVDAMDWEGMALFLLDDPSCLPLLSEALQLSRSLDPILEATHARLLTHIATVHISRHDWREAIRYYGEAANASEKVRDLAQVARTYDGLSQAYSKLGQSGRALSYANKALALYSMQADLGGLYRAEHNIGDLLLRQGDTASAETHLLKALEGFRDLGLERRGIGYVLVNLAEVAFRRGDRKTALALTEDAAELARSLGEKVVEANSQLLLARIASDQQDQKGAETQFNRAIELLTALDMPERLREARLAYGRFLRERGQIARAADQFERAAESGQHVTDNEPVIAALELLSS